MTTLINIIMLTEEILDINSCVEIKVNEKENHPFSSHAIDVPSHISYFIWKNRMIINIHSFIKSSYL